jgi:hypothetical protein
MPHFPEPNPDLPVRKLTTGPIPQDTPSEGGA